VKTTKIYPRLQRSAFSFLLTARKLSCLFEQLHILSQFYVREISQTDCLVGEYVFFIHPAPQEPCSNGQNMTHIWTQEPGSVNGSSHYEQQNWKWNCRFHCKVALVPHITAQTERQSTSILDPKTLFPTPPPAVVTHGLFCCGQIGGRPGGTDRGVSYKLRGQNQCPAWWVPGHPTLHSHHSGGGGGLILTCHLMAGVNPSFIRYMTKCEWEGENTTRMPRFLKEIAVKHSSIMSLTHERIQTTG
jgi:hypothetical protein